MSITKASTELPIGMMEKKSEVEMDYYIYDE